MKHLRPAAAWMALAAAATLMPAVAAEETLQEVIVTARRVAEDIARVPLSIGVVTSDGIGPGGVEDLASLAGRFPGLSFESLWGGQGAALMLRGLSQPSTAGDNVGLFVDDVYQPGRAAMDVDMLDLDHIEVVRGPQNTYLGRSTFAGAVRFVPAAPTSHSYLRLQADAGTDALAGVQGVWSGPVGSSGWGVRASAASRRSDGAFAFPTGDGVGDSERRSLALTLAHGEAELGRRFSLHVRLGEARSGHPATNTLDADDFNCGARDERSGYWSYYCGELPVPAPAALTDGLPDSRAGHAQASVRIDWPLAGRLSLSSLGSFYHAGIRSIRDFDGGDQGFWSGVCTIEVNCHAGAPLSRFAFPEVVSNSQQRVTDWSQELRLAGKRRGIDWMLGVAATWTRTREAASFGADRGDLAPTERLTAIAGANPLVVGRQSQLNRALVEDSRTTQVLAAETFLRNRSLAAFGMVEVPLASHLAGRIELRAEREVQHVAPRIAAFLPVEEEDPPAGRFRAVTPRLSLDFRPSTRWHAFASLARGARSGGVNTQPGLDEEERTYGPEYNWTTEAGLRHAGHGVLGEFDLTLWHVDWRNTQLMSVATKPGVNALIMRNTRGIVARGVEAALQLRAGRLLVATLSGSIADTAFRAGSDDPGARQICGLASQPPDSDFCAYGPPRSGNGSVPLVAYLDGNRTARVPRGSWTALLEMPPLAVHGGWRLGAQATLSSQRDVTDRPVEGTWYGARRVLGARLALHRDPWQLALWGTNLTNARYIRVVGARGAAWYPDLPRPIDLLHGEGRRIGLSLRYAAGAPRPDRR